MGRHAPRGPVKMHQGDPLVPADPMESPQKVTCVAHNRQGKRCGRAPIHGGTVCYMHGGAAPQVLASARERLLALQPQAIQTLAALLVRDEFPTVQLGAVRDVLDRTEGKAAEQVRITGKDDGPLEIVIKKPW